MRNLPLRVHAVAREPAPDLVVDAPERHALERIDGDPLGRAVARRGGAAQAEFEIRRVRKLRRSAETAVTRIEIRLQTAQGLGYRRRGELRMMRGHARLHAFEGGENRLVLAPDFLALLAVDPRDALEQLRESRKVVARLLGKISTAEKRRAVRREEHGERPPARPLGEHLVRELIDLIEIRTFLAVHFDVDEQAIHHLGHRRVLEGLVRHHVAPVAGGVPDREEDRLVLLARASEGFFSPGVPVDGIPRVLLEIGTGFLREAIGHDRGLLGVSSV